MPSPGARPGNVATAPAGQKRLAKLRWKVTMACGTEFHYLKVKLVFDKSPRVPLTDLQVRLHIAAACSQLYGIAGSAAAVDVLNLEHAGADAVALLRILSVEANLVCSALAVYSGPRATGVLDSSVVGHEPGSMCRFEVVRRSNYLMALASDSRSWAAKLGEGL